MGWAVWFDMECLLWSACLVMKCTCWVMGVCCTPMYYKALPLFWSRGSRWQQLVLCPVCTVPVEEVVYNDVCWVFVLCVDSLPLFKMNGLFLCIAEYLSAPRWLCINGHPQGNWIFGLFCISSGVKSNSWLVTRLLFKVCVPALQTAAPQGPLMAACICVGPCHRACYIHSLFGLKECLI